MAEIVIKGLSWFLVIAMYVVAYAMPCLYVYHTGRLGRGVLYSWLAQIGFMILMSQVVFELLIHIFPDHLELICKSFPEGNSIVAAFCSGWIFALIICGIAKLIYKGRNKSAGWKFGEKIPAENKPVFNTIKKAPQKGAFLG